MRNAFSILIGLSLSYNVLATFAFYEKDQELTALKKKYKRLRAWAEISARILVDQEDEDGDLDISANTQMSIRAYRIFEDNNLF